MSASQEAVQKKTTTLKFQTMQAVVSGKIEYKNVYNGNATYIIKTKAKDEYSHPATIEVRSDDRNKQVGDIVENIKVEISGIPRNYETKNGDKVHSATMYLNEIHDPHF